MSQSPSTTEQRSSLRSANYLSLIFSLFAFLTSFLRYRFSLGSIELNANKQQNNEQATTTALSCLIKSFIYASIYSNSGANKLVHVPSVVNDFYCSNYRSVAWIRSTKFSLPTSNIIESTTYLCLDLIHRIFKNVWG